MTLPRPRHALPLAVLASTMLAAGAAAQSETILVAGLEHPVDIVIDFYPVDPELSAHGVDLSLIDDEVVELYRAARAPVEFIAADLAAAHRGENADAAIRRLTAWTQPEPDWLRELGVGSNNWVISGELSASGAPMLANDPHRSISIPPLRYVVHLVGPGSDVIGAGEPTVPGVSMGHNRYGAFGLTIHGLDMEDLYVYETNPADPDQYRYHGGWDEMRVIEETIPVEGHRPVTVELKYTRHGPVLHEDPEHNRAYALRAAWLEPGTAPYLASLRYGQARNWEEFRDGAAHHLGPAYNIVWADVHGDIGWQVSGIAPLRDGWTGLLPVPSDGSYEWDGYLPVRELPHELNPARGFIATANEHNMPAGYPHVFSYEFSEPFRSMRIHEILGASRELTIEDLKRIQLDELSIPARTLVPLLRRVEPAGEAAREAWQRLLAWDYVLDQESIPAAIYIAWERRLKQNLRERVVPAAAREMIRSLPTLRVVEWLDEPDARLGADPVAARDALLRLSLDHAVEDLRERLGPDMEKWQYGQQRFKHVAVRHALSDLADPAMRDRLAVGPVSRGRTGYTVNPTGGGDNQTHGPSYRIIADASDWDAAVGITTPGQSGDPTSPHYTDLFDAWTEGECIPLTYSRDRVRSATERVLQLVPLY